MAKTMTFVSHSAKEANALDLLEQTGWRRSWGIVPSGSGSLTDLLFYDLFATTP
jgi:hypothetical protein